MKPNLAWSSLSLASLFALAACGGGSSSSSAPPPPPPASLAIGGTAATGAALANALVEVKCAAGTGSATTRTDGRYDVALSGGTLPCALRVTSGGTVLHSIVASGGATVVVNITPLTELLAANVAGGAPDTLFTTFDATAQARITPAAVTDSVAAVLAALRGTIDLSDIDPIGGTLVAANGSNAGNALDALLDQLAAALAVSQSTLADLSAAVATRTPSSPPVLRDVAARATSCAALRSGNYHVMNPHETAHDVGHAAYRLAIDAADLTMTDVEPGHAPDSVTLTPVPDHACSFTYAGEFGAETALVSPGGVIVVRSPSSTGPTRTSLIVPEQSIALGQLAGLWDYMAYVDGENGGTLTPTNGVRTIDGAGKFVAGTECVGLTCTLPEFVVQPNDLAVDANGGFAIAGSNGAVARAFAFIADDGSMSLYVLDPSEGGLSIATKQAALSLPGVGDVSTFWDFTVGSGSFRWAPLNNAQGGASALADNTVTVTAVDTAAHSFTRLRTADQRVDSFTINSPVDGLRARPATSSVSATITMPVRGTGLVVYTSVAANQNFFGFSISHP